MVANTNAALGDKRSAPLDALRGAAILLVLIGHYLAPALGPRLPVLQPLLQITWCGVDLFFVLSGFLLGGILLKNRDSPSFFAPFYGRRALRILPLYIALIVLFAGADLDWSLVSLTQNINWGLANVWGSYTLAPTWSLAVEEQFYLLLPILIRFCPPRLLPAALSSLILFAPVTRAALHWLGYPQAAYYFMPARMDSLFLGVLVAWCWADQRRRDYVDRHVFTAAFVASAAGFIVLLLSRQDALGWWMSVPGYSVIATFFAACLWWTLGRRELEKSRTIKAVSLLGLAAYSIYLFHMPFLVVARDSFGQSKLALAAAAVALIPMAAAAWLLVERPCIRFGHRHLAYQAVSGACT